MSERLTHEQIQQWRMHAANNGDDELGAALAYLDDAEAENARLRKELGRKDHALRGAVEVIDHLLFSVRPKIILDPAGEARYYTATRELPRPEGEARRCACGCAADQHHGPSQGCDGGHACGTFWPRREGIGVPSDYDSTTRAALHPEEGANE